MALLHFSPHLLSKGDFMTRFCPGGIFLQAESDLQTTFTLQSIRVNPQRLKRQCKFLCAERLYVPVWQFTLPDPPAVTLYTCHAAVSAGGGKQVSVMYPDCCIRERKGHRCIAALYLLHLGRFRMIRIIRSSDAVSSASRNLSFFL